MSVPPIDVLTQMSETQGLETQLESQTIDPSALRAESSNVDALALDSVPITVPQPVKRPRGRPRGSVGIKRKQAELADALNGEPPVKRPRGRPPGSGRKRGAATTSGDGVSQPTTNVPDTPTGDVAPPPKRPRGRPRGSGNKRGAVAGRNDILEQQDSRLAPGLIRRVIKGSHPPSKSGAHVAVDDVGGRIFVYGGGHSEDDTITGDFHVCYTDGQVRWENWTDILGHTFLKPCPLPALESASMSYMAFNGCEYVFLFGGHNPDANGVTSSVIAIDVSSGSKTWFYVPLDGDVMPRLDATCVGIENKLYVFGGQAAFGEDVLASYSVAEYIDSESCWRWTVQDQAYPSHVSALTYHALPVSDGSQILLTTKELSVQTVFFFDVETHDFLAADDIHGDVPPTDFVWSTLYHITSYPQRNVSLRLPSTDSTDLAPIEPFALVCGWGPGDNQVAVDLWKLAIAPGPGRRMQRLNLDIQGLGVELRSFVAVGGRFLLFGGIASGFYDTCVEMDMRVLDEDTIADTVD